MLRGAGLMLSKILGAATVGSALASVGLLHRFLSGIASIVMLSVVGAFMICVLLASGFYMAYSSLVFYGLDPYVAGITMAAIAFFITVILVALMIGQIHRLRELPYHHLSPNGAGLPDVSHIVGAFVDGFLNHKK